MPAYGMIKRWERLAKDLNWWKSIEDLRWFVLKVLWVMDEKDQQLRVAMARYYFGNDIQRKDDPGDSRFQQFLVVCRGHMRTVKNWEEAKPDMVGFEQTNENDLITMIMGGA